MARDGKVSSTAATWLVIGGLVGFLALIAAITWLAMSASRWRLRALAAEND